MTRLRNLPGLGPQSEKMLGVIRVQTKSDLEQIGPVRAFLRLRQQGAKPSLNLLYAMSGALEGRSWLEIARSRRVDLALELDGYSDLKRQLEKEGIELQV